MMEKNDPTSAFYQGYNLNTVPTDFEYVGVRSDPGRGWFLRCQAVHLQLQQRAVLSQRQWQ